MTGGWVAGWVARWVGRVRVVTSHDRPPNRHRRTRRRREPRAPLRAPAGRPHAKSKLQNLFQTEGRVRVGRAGQRQGHHVRAHRRGVWFHAPQRRRPPPRRAQERLRARRYDRGPYSGEETNAFETCCAHAGGTEERAAREYDAMPPAGGRLVGGRTDGRTGGRAGGRP